MNESAKDAIVFVSVTFAACLAMKITGNTNYLWLMVLGLLFV